MTPSGSYDANASDRASEVMKPAGGAAVQLAIRWPWDNPGRKRASGVARLRRLLGDGAAVPSVLFDLRREGPRARRRSAAASGLQTTNLPHRRQARRQRHEGRGHGLPGRSPKIPVQALAGGRLRRPHAEVGLFTRLGALPVVRIDGSQQGCHVVRSRSWRMLPLFHAPRSALPALRQIRECRIGGTISPRNERAEDDDRHRGRRDGPGHAVLKGEISKRGYVDLHASLSSIKLACSRCTHRFTSCPFRGVSHIALAHSRLRAPQR